MSEAVTVAAKSESGRPIAAVDLGSNSFHMIVADVDAQGHMRVIDKIRESVRLRGGLDAQKNLSSEARERALECLERFGERIKDFSAADVAAVGTNTLRTARKARQFLDAAERALGHHISVISGSEEARLIYLGVSHTLADDAKSKRFVMDIGGGSTELIIGEGFEAKYLESLPMGCVSGSQRFFPDGRLDKSCWERAITAAKLELMPIQRSYRDIGWESETGASGTIKAVLKMIQQCELSPYIITPEHLRELQKRMVAAGHVDQLDIPGLSNERKPVIAGGLAILISTFEALGLKEMQVSDGALREGLVYDRLDRWQHGDLRSKTVAAVQARFHVDREHASVVGAMAVSLFDACQAAWGLEDDLRQLLVWAADLHEVGLAISHSGHHKHSGYLLKNLDLAGFSTEEQDILSMLVRTHRRKISLKHFDESEVKVLRETSYLVVLLRLSILVNRARNNEVAAFKQIKAGDNALELVFVGLEDERPLLAAGLEEEQGFLEVLGIRLDYAFTTSA